MRVVVTGGCGLLGRYVMEALHPHFEAVSLDIQPEAHVSASVLDLEALARSFNDVDCVLHIAAAANIHSGPPKHIMEMNVMGSWNVLQAASRAGVRRVVLCSSDSVLGNTVWPDHFHLPSRLPVDEGQPLHPVDPYGLSKMLAEETGRSFADRGVLEVLALRPVFILFPSMMGEARARHSDPDAYSGPQAGGHVGAGGGLCWHHVDPRDVADAFVRAIRSDYDGYRAFYIAAPSTLYPKPTLERIHDYFGRLPSDVDEDWFRDNPFAPMFDIRSASKHLGWHARYDRRGEVFNVDPITELPSD